MHFLHFTIFLLCKEVWSCGYQSCTETKKGVLNVHIVPHSHDDTGWVKTFDEYYAGEIREILHSVVQELWKDPKRRFIYVETAFFWRWWGEQDEHTKNQVHVLVAEGRLKFVGGAWTMNDEATTHYQSIIDQFTWGLRKLNETFGPCATPKVAWQIDPFGHSREMAALLAAMSYDGLFLCRINSKELDKRRSEKTLELVWRGDDDLGSSSDIYTGILYNHYSAPDGFNFEKPYASLLIDVEAKIKHFHEYINVLSSAYTTNNILIPMGDDFAYTDAGIWFENLDLLIDYFNMKSEKENLNISMFYSTPDCYLLAVKNANPTLPVKHDDFFPYSNENGYWTGYYTSRPTLKYFERDANRYLQMVKQLFVITGLEQDKNSSNIDEFRSAMGIMQHHDAITGTEKQYVAENYKKMLNQAVENTLPVADKAFTKFVGGHSDSVLYKYYKCQLNQSECAISENSENFIVTVYNPLAWTLHDVDVVVPVLNAQYVIYDTNSKIIETRLVPINEWFQKNIPARRSIATHELIFKVVRLGPLGFQSYYIEKHSDLYYNKKLYADNSDLQDQENEFFEYGSSIMSYIGSGYYPSLRSCAYTFNPLIDEPKMYFNIEWKNIYKIKNHIKNNVNVVLKRIKKYGNNAVVQVQWLCNPIYLGDRGKEVVVRYSSDVINNGIFYTDSNGRQMIRRNLINQDKNPEIAVGENYYPVPCKICITDNDIKLTIFTDRPEGGYSPQNGTIELMINRKLILNPDLFGTGLDEPLDEKDLVTVVNHYIMVSDINDKRSVLDEKRFKFEIHMSPIILFSDANKFTLQKWLKMRHSNEGLMREFPKGLHLLTLEPWGEWKLLLRLENYLDRFDLTSAIEIDLCDIFSTITIRSIRETTLAANRWLYEHNSWNWRKRENSAKFSNDDFATKLQRFFFVRSKGSKTSNKCSKVQLYSKQIRTFIIEYEMKSSF